MSRANVIVLTRKMILSLAAVLVWIFVITGVFSLLAESYAVGALWLGLAIVIVIGLVQRNLMSRLEGRHLPLPSILLVLVVLLLVGITEFINLLMTKPSMSVTYLFDAAYSLGILIIGGYAMLQLLRSMRNQSQGR